MSAHPPSYYAALEAENAKLRGLLAEADRYVAWRAIGKPLLPDEQHSKHLLARIDAALKEPK